jgi:hypothetical protein
VLEAELKQLSESLRVPVSNIVRAAIEDVLQAAQTVTRTAGDEVQVLADRLDLLRRRAERYGERHADEPNEPDEPDEPDEPGSAQDEDEGAERASVTRAERALRGVIGFQKITLARPTRCGICGRNLAAGEAAFMAIRDRRGRRIILGSECLPAPERKEQAE